MPGRDKHSVTENFVDIAEDFISVEEAGRVLRRPKKSIYNLCATGALPGYKIGGRLLLRRSELVKIVLAGRKISVR